MQRSIDVAATHRLDEGTSDVVVLVTVPVVAHGRDVDRALDDVDVDPGRRVRRIVGTALGGGVRGLLLLHRRRGRGLEHGQCLAGVPADEPDEVGQRVVGQLDPAAEPPLIPDRPRDEAGDVVGLERVEGEQQRARQQR